MHLIKIFLSSTIIFTFLYSQVLWAAGYELYRSIEEDLTATFSNPQEAMTFEARKQFLLRRQQEIEGARRIAFNWSYPLHEPNKELTRNLYYQQINATRTLVEGKRHADELTGRIGPYGKYYIKHDDGMVTWYFNALLTDIIGEKIKDKLGHQSIQDTLDMLYNEKRQLISFNQKITDERGNVTSKIWDSAAYWSKEDMRLDPGKEKDTLASYHEEITYPTGELIDRRVANLTYYTEWDETQNPSHIEDQIASYDEIKLSNQSPDAPISSHWYNAGYLKRPHTYTQFDPFDEEKYPDEDDRFDTLLTGFIEDSTTLDVTTTRVWSNPVYNEHEQITSYHESIDSLGFHTERDFYDAEYDEWGRLISYRERIDTEGLVTERYWHGARYNNIDQLLYYEEDLYSGGVWTYTTWSDPVYNSIGQLTSYHTLVESGGIEIETWRANIIYNSYGLPSSYDEVITSLGMTITTNRRNITYESHGWITGWDDTIREQASYVDETGRVVNIDRTYTLRRYDMTYYWNGLTAGYRELLLDPLGITTSTYRYDMQYNRQGLLISYIEEVTKAGLTTRTIRDSITYNEYGQMTEYHDIIVTNETSGITTEITRSDIGYNNEGWVTEYTETTRKYASDRSQYDTTVTTRRYDIIYNRIGKPTRYKEETTNELGTKVTKEWWNSEYNPVGLLTVFYEKITYPDRVIQTHQYRMIYDSNDRIVGYITEDTDPFGITTRTERKEISYIGQLLSSYHEDVLRLGQTSSKDWSMYSYNKIGQILEYEERAIDIHGVSLLTIMTGMEYNLFGQLVKYRSTTERGTDYRNIREWTGTYNQRNMLNTFTETNTITDGIITQKTKTERKSTGYNVFGYITNLEEDTTDDANPDKKANRKWYNATYGDKGILLGYTEEETALGVTKKTVRSDITYNGVSQITGYLDTITESNQPDKTVTITRSGMVYNEKGRIIEYNEGVAEQSSALSLNLNYRKTTQRRNILTDSIGNQTSYEDTINETSSQDYTARKTWSGRYNSLGLVTHYEETTKKGNRSQIVVIRDIVYDTKGLQLRYTESTRDDAVPDKTTTRKWEASGYNAKGELSGYVETIDEGKPTQRILTRSGMVYQNNFLTSYSEVINDSTTPDKTINNTWTAAYNTLGQLSSFSQTQQEPGKTTTQNRSSITYDSQGREYSYTQTDTDSSSPDKVTTTTRTETLYNTKGLVQNYRESQNQIDYTIQKTRSITYNNDEQVTSYIEEQVNTASPDKTTKTTWTAEGYDLLGQLMGDTTVTEETLNGKVTERRTGLTYNNKGQLLRYTKTKESDAASGLTEETQWQGTYNGLGLLTSYSQTETRYDESTNGTVYKTVQKTNRSMRYKTNGQIDNYSETVTDHNPDTDVENKTTKTEWQAIGYNRLGQLTDYEQTVTETAVGLFTEKTTTRRGITYTNGLVTSYSETLRDNITSNKTTETTWSGTYNRLGQLSSYAQTDRETGTDSHGNSIDSTTTIDQTGITYNNLGQVYRYTSKRKYPTGVIETITRTDTQYNNLGLVTYYDEQIRRIDEVGIFTTHTFKVTEYDRSGKVLTYEDIKIDSLGVQATKKISNVTYNDKGQITSYREESTEYGITTITDWSTDEDGYNGYNTEGQLIKFREVSTTLDVVTTRDWQGAVYNDDGRLIYYTETRTINPGRTYSILWKNAEYDLNGNLTKFTEETTDGDLLITRTRSGATYTANGLILQYNETINKKGANLDTTTTRTWSTTSADYDSQNRILRYNETTIENGVSTTTAWSVEGYTSKNQITGYTQTDTVNGITTTTTRTNMTYNANGELTGHIDTITSTDAPGFTTTLTRQAQTYDFGQLDTYVEIIQYTGPDLNKTITTNRTSTTYTNGLVTGFSETITDIITKTITRTNQSYNNLNQITGFTESIHSQGAGLDITQTTVRYPITYNTIGLESGYTETITNTVTPDLIQTITVSNKTYDSSGRLLLGYNETITKKDISTSGTLLNSTTTRTWSTTTEGYDALDRLLSYTETVTQDGVTEENTWTVEGYNTNNQITGYSEVTTNTVRTAIGYNANGEITGYKDTITDTASPGLTTTIERSGMAYTSGMLTGYSDLIHYTGILSNDYKYDIDRDDETEGGDIDYYEKIIYTDIDYNDRDQIYSYNRQSGLTDSDGNFIGLVTNTERQSTDYWPAGFIKGYYEEITTTDTAPTEKIHVTDIQYDTGRIKSYITETERTGTLEDTYKQLNDHDGSLLQSGEDLNTTANIKTEITEFDSSNRPKAYIETNLDDSTVTQYRNINYNNLGMRWSYDTSDTNRYATIYNSSGEESGYYEENTDGDEIWTYDMQYNESGELLSSASTIHRTGTLDTIYNDDLNNDGTMDGQDLDLWQGITQTGNSYNNLGQLISYTKTINGKETVPTHTIYDENSVEIGYREGDTITYNIQYNTQDLAEKWTTKTKQGDAITTIERLSTGYNSDKLVTDYSEEATNNYNELKTKITKEGITYNNLGQEYSVKTTIEELDTIGAREGDHYYSKKEITRSKTQYNSTGLVSSYLETETRLEDERIITRTGYDYGYDGLDRLIQYIQKESVLGYTTTTTWENIGGFDEQDRDIGFIKTTTSDINSLTVIETRTSAPAYDAYGRERGYTTTIEESSADGAYTLTRQIITSEIEYDHVGLRESWREEIPGDTTTVNEISIKSHDRYGRPRKIVTNTKIDGSYTDEDEVTHEVHRELETTKEAIANKDYYNELGQIENIKITTKDLISNTTKTIEQRNMEYNEKWQLASYTHKERNETTDMIDARYNPIGQLEYYKQVIDEDEHWIEWKDPSYNIDGRLTGYTKEEINGDDTDTTLWENAEYDSLGQLTHFEETFNDEDPVVWDGETYEDMGQYLSFYTNSTLGPDVAGLYNQLPERIEKVQGTKTPESPKVVPSNLSIINTLINIIISPVTAILDNGTLIKSVTPDLIKASTLKPIKLLINTYYNVLTLQPGITSQTLDTKARFFEELPNDQGLDLEITTRLETQYNPTGQVISYRELITQIGGTWSPIGELVTTTQQKTLERTDITYNIFGQVISFNETETNDKGVKKETERTDIDYTDLGFVESYKEKRVELGIEKGEDVSNLTYNEQGQLVAYHSILKEQATSYTAGGTPIRYELTTTTERLSTTYESGRLTGLTERIWSSSTPGLTSTIEKTDITYNIFGQVSGLIEKVSTPFETVTSMKSNLAYAPGGNLLSFQEKIISTVAPDLVTIRNWSGAKYSPRGELKGYVETISREGSDLIRQIRKSGITYDILGRVIGYKLTEQELGVTKTTTRQNITYNLLHQLTGYEEITNQGRILFTGAEYDVTGKLLKFTKQTSELGQSTITQERLNTVYNDLGQIVAYDEKTTKLDLTQLLSVNNIQYNAMGQMLGYIQQSRTIGGPLDYSETTIRSNSLYDTFGRLASYNEADSSTNKHVTLNYNSYDQLTNYTETGIKYGDPYQYTKTNMQYDSKNRLASYTETNIGVAEQSSALINLSYNNLNQVTNRYEQGTDRKGTYSIQTKDIQYNDIGQQLAFSQTRTQNNLTEITTRTHTAYNSVGLVSGYSETSVIASGAKQSRTVSSITYDNQSRTLGFTEAGTNEDTSSYTFTRSQLQYDAKQRIISFQEQSSNYNFIRNNITYDKFNRVTNYTEQGVNQGTYNLTKSITYNDQDQVTSFTEQGWRQNSGNYNTNRSNIIYDSLGRVTEFSETGWTQGQGSYNLHRYAINYQQSAISSYTETGWQEGKGTYTTERSKIQYTNGLLTSFHEKTSSSDGSQVEFDRINITYNANQQITGYQETGSRAGTGNYSLTRSGITYNTTGQITEYRESGSNWDGSYSYHRHNINYHPDGRLSEYREDGTDTKGKGYSFHRYSMNYHGSGLLASYSENSNEGHRDVWNMSYDGNGQLIRQEARTDKDQFQFGGHATYTFSYDGNGNLTQTRVDTNDYWVTFDGKGNQTGQGLSAQMQNYINDLQRQAEEAEREAEGEMRSAEDKINEAIEEERRAMEEEAAATVVDVETKRVKRGKNKWDIITIYHYADGSTSTDTERVKGNKKQAKRKAEEARRKAEKARGLATSKKAESERKSKEAKERADNAKRQADSARGKAEDARRQASSRRDQASSKAQEARTKAERAKETARATREKVIRHETKTITTEPRIQVTKTKNADGSTTVILVDRLTGARRELRFDSYGDMTYKQAKNAKGEITHFETHQYTRDSRGRITSDTYHKEITTVTSQPIGKPIKYTDKDGNTKTYQRSQQQRDKVIEDGKIEYNKYGQVTSADIKRRVITDISKGGDKWKNVSDYTMEIKLTTDQDSMGRVTAEHESTHIFGKEGYQDKNGKWKSKDVDYTINRDRTYSYNGNSILPSGWHEKVTQSNMDLVIETDVWDIKYDDKGRMIDYRGKTHEYGSYIDEKGKKQTIDVIREFHRHDITYNDKNQMTSYREERWSSDRPGLIQFAYVYDIQYNSAGLMTSYMEVLREVGYVSLEGVPKGLAPPSFGLEETMQVIAEMANGTSDLLSQYYLVDKTTITHRQNIQYNGLNQITGYTDTITNPDGTTTTVQMTGITYWSDGRMKGYSQTTTGPDDEGKIKTHTTNIYNTEYDPLGRIDEKYGTYDGKKYKWQAISYDELGRPTAYKEKYGKVSSKHYDILYNELGDVAYEKIKTTQKSAFSKSTNLTEYWYGYDEYGQLEKTKENEIYNKSGRTLLGKIFDFIFYGPLAFLPDDIFLKYIKPAMDAVLGYLNPMLIPLLILKDTIRAILSGVSIGDALKGAAIQLLVWAITQGLSGGAPPAIPADQFVQQIMTKAIQTIAGRVIFDLLEDKLGTFGAALVSALISNLITTISPIAGDTGFLAQDGTFDGWGLIQTLGQAGIKALIAEIAKRNPDLAWALPLLETMLNMAISQAIQEARKEDKIKDLESKGYRVLLDEKGNISSITKVDANTDTIYYYTADEKLIFSEQLVEKDGQYYAITTYTGGYTEISIRDSETGSWKLIFQGLSEFNSVETYQNKEGTTLQFISLTAPDGTTTYFELDGRPVLSTLPDGRIMSYNYNGQPEGILAKDALPRWNEDGTFKDSYIETKVGTTYFDKYGIEKGFILNGYTAIERGDEIVGQTRQISEDTYIYRDNYGEFINKITQTKDGGILANNGKYTAYIDSSNTNIWIRENTEHSDIYFYDSVGQNIIEILSTQLDESGLVKGYLYTDTLTGNITLYNEDGDYQGFYLARKDDQDNIIGYQGRDKDGNFVVLDRRQDILYKLDDKGIFTLYDIDPSTEYLVLRSESIYIVGEGNNIRGVLDLNQETGKYILYDSLGNFITNNPVYIVARLISSLLTIPKEIRDNLLVDAKTFLQSVKDNIIPEIKSIRRGSIMVLTVPEGIDPQDYIDSINKQLIESGLAINKYYQFENLLQVQINEAYHYELTKEGQREYPLKNPARGYSTEYMMREGLLQRLLTPSVLADSTTGTPDYFMKPQYQKLTEAFRKVYEKGEIYKGYTAVDAYKDGKEYKQGYKDTYKLAKDMLSNPLFKAIDKDNKLQGAINEIRLNNLTKFFSGAKGTVDDINQFLSQLTGSEKDTLKTLILKQAMLEVIAKDSDLKDEYLNKILDTPVFTYGDMARLKNGKPILIALPGFNTGYYEALSPAGMQAVSYKRFQEIKSNLNVLGFIWNGNVPPGKFSQAQLQATEAAYALASQIIAIHKALPGQPIILESHSLGAQVIGDALKILATLGYTGDKKIVDIVFMTAPAVDRGVFNLGGIYYDAAKAAGKVGIFRSDRDLVLQNLYGPKRFVVDWEPRRALGEKGPFEVNLASNVEDFDLTPHKKIDPITGEVYWESSVGRDALVFSHGDYFRAGWGQIGGMYDTMKREINKYLTGINWTIKPWEDN